jgi:hypothetical protein
MKLQKLGGYASNHFIVTKDGKTIRGTSKGRDAKGKPYESLEVWEKQ